MKKIGTLEILPNARTWRAWASSYIGGRLLNYFEDPSTGFATGPMGSGFSKAFAPYVVWVVSLKESRP